ncbi:MAG TPA: TrkA family potassium uptake protein [Bacteroidales bacterium]|nr:TrkA family potassium uptake protein [Bacteroidales bacterium]
MNFIVIGLGNFGASLAKRLTALGHDVIGVDKELEKVEFFKDVITNTISMDITDIHALKTLPLKDCDMVIVCIGDDFGSSVKTTALLKKLGVTNLYGRESSLIHKTVLNAIGVTNTINPEYDTAFVFAEKLIMTGVISIFSITDELKIAEINLPEEWIGKKLDEVDKTNIQGIDIVSLKFPDPKGSRQLPEKWVAISVNKCKPEMLLENGMRLVIQGSKKEIMNFMRM